MFHQSKFDLNSSDGNARIASPNFNKPNSPMSLSPYARNATTTPTRSTIKRYSLADTSSPMRSKELSYNAHISTKIDSNSPGYSSRVVQYNQEQEKLLPTHQTKYDRLGVFPIVHIFKKDLPFPKRKLTEISNHMNSSDLSRYNSAEHNKMLLERIIKSSPGRDIASPDKSETNPKSVLDALKEISRKRIHSSEGEFVLKDDGKRVHSDYDSESTTRKRMKQNIQGDSTITSPGHRNQTIEELKASHSSMEGYFSPKPKTQKNNLNQQPLEIKPKSPLKYVNVETQTSTPQIPITKPVITTSEKVEKETPNPINNYKEIKIKKPSPVKIFDERPLETMRKNRLSALLGSSESKKAQNQEVASKVEDKSSFGKPLVSILAGNSKSPHKVTKHVTFDIPVTSTATTIAAETIGISNEVSSPSKVTNEAQLVTKTSTAILAPIVSATVVTELSPANKISLGPQPGPQLTISSSNQPNVTSTVSPISSSVLFPSADSSSGSGLSQKEDKPKNPETKFGDTISPKNLMFTPTFTNPSVSQSPAAHPTQPSGFKFELKESQPTVASTAPVTFSFMPSYSTPTANTSPFSQTSTTSTPSSKGNVPSFGLGSTMPSVASPGITPTFSIQTPKNSLISSPAPFSMNKGQSANSGVTTSSNFLAPPNQVVTTSSSFLPANTVVTTSLNFLSSNSAATPPKNFFGMKMPANSTTPTPTFFTNNPQPAFGTNVTTQNFVPPATSTNTPSLFAFGTNATPNTTTTSAFTANPRNLFDSSSKHTFGSVTTASTLLLPNSSAAKPNISTPVNFSAPGNDVFGNNATTAPSGFNKLPTSFNATPSALTGNVTKTTANTFSFASSSGPFNTNAAMFANNNNNNPGFGGDGAGKFAFAQAAPTPFGAAASLGTSNPAAAPSTNSFGTTTTTANSNIFGSGSTFTTTSFGSNTTGSFGTTNFGINQNSPFNPAPANEAKSSAPFGAASAATPFNKAATSAPAFSANTVSFSTAGGFPSTGGFGQTANPGLSSTFGTASPFEKNLGSNNSEVAPPFGSANSSFGTGNFSSNAAPGQGNVFAFGSNSTAAAKPAVFSFGSSEPPKPSFNFSSENNNNNSNVFGVNNRGFGNNPSPFNPVAANQVAYLQPPGGAMFNIGTGGNTTPSRSRTQHKAKRRT